MVTRFVLLSAGGVPITPGFSLSRFVSDKHKRQFTFVLFHQAFPFTLTTPWAAGVSSAANLNANAVLVCLLSGVLGLSWAGERDCRATGALLR